MYSMRTFFFKSYYVQKNKYLEKKYIYIYDNILSAIIYQTHIQILL